MIGIFLRQKNANEALTIVGDGEQRRDFVHVQDVVNANIMASLEDLMDEYYGQIYNIGTGENISILEIAKMISDNRVHIPFRDGEAKTTLACIDKVKDILNWKPNVKLLEWISHQ